MANELEILAELFVDDYKNIEEIENDDFLNIDFKFEGEDFAYEQAFIFIKHFFYMGYRIFSLKSLIEDVEQTKNENKKEDPETKTNSMNLEDKNLEIFKNALEYNYPMDYSPITFFVQWKSNLSYLKKEILLNLIILPPERRKPYLNSLKFELEEMLENCQTSIEELEAVYNNYITSEKELLKNRSYTNPLHIALNSDPEKFGDSYKEGYNPDTDEIQFTFYNYHYGKTIRDAIEFIGQQEIEHTSSSKQYEKKENEPNVSNNSIKSFEYINLQTGLENITYLLTDLKKLDLINKDTELKYFRNVFSKKTIISKIIWTGNISQLSYFIKYLHNVSKQIKDTKQKQWDITINCFEMADGSELEKSKLRTQKPPANAKEIEKAVNNL